MSDARFEEMELGTLLRRLLAALDGDVQQVYDELVIDFRPRFFPVVRYLRAKDTAAVGELADHAGVSQPAITQTLSEMQAAGLVLIEHGRDRRHRRVRLSTEGQAVSARLEPVWNAVRGASDALNAELPAHLRTTLTAALASLEAKPFRDRIFKQMEEK